VFLSRKRSSCRRVVPSAPRFVATLTLAVAGVGSIAGCSQTADPTATPTSFVQVIDEWLAYARDEGKASDEQIQMLERARAAGEVTRAVLDEATANYLACMDDAGIDYIVEEQETLPGSEIYMPGVLIPAPDPNSTREIDISDACEWRHQVYVLSAYGNQPLAFENQDRMWVSTVMRDCLAAQGFASDDDATAREMEELFNRASQEHSDDPNYVSCVPPS
jgi:hypothetical protein